MKSSYINVKFNSIGIFILILFSYFFNIIALAEINPLELVEIKLKPPYGKENLEGKIEYNKVGVLDKTWKLIKGKPTRNAVILGMFSKHTSKTRRNEDNHMVGIQYKGYTAGSFINSYHDRTYFAGVSREVWQKKINDNFYINFHYRAGLLHGYGDHYPDFIGLTPVILPIIGFDYKGKAIDITIIPDDKPIFCINFRINFSKFSNIKMLKSQKTFL